MSSTTLESFLRHSPPADLGPGPRDGAASIPDIDHALRNSHANGSQRDLIRALLLLWNDHHEAAHSIVQDLETREGSYIHAILHRREPDYFNSKYWFRRVGQHPCFGDLAARAGVILNKHHLPNLAKKLVPLGQWDPFTFVDACEADATPSAPNCEVLREIQQAEFEILLDHLSR